MRSLKSLNRFLADNPDYLGQPKGPVWAMRDMEDYMKDVLGYKDDDVVSAEKRGAQREMARQNRVIVSSTKGRTVGDSGKVVKLSKDDMEFLQAQRDRP